MNNFFLSILGVSLFVLSLTLVHAFCRYALKQGLLDIPNSRSSHSQAVPRGGGIVFVLLWICCLLGGAIGGWFTGEVAILLPGAFLIALLGFWDDHQPIAANKRLILQLLIASLTVWQMGGVFEIHLLGGSKLHVGWLGTFLAILGLVWSVNTFNFMDGLDGVASIEALTVFGIGGCLLWKAGAVQLAGLAGTLVIAVSGFLVWNWPKARVFMGDVGSYFLGFLVAMFALLADKHYQIPLALWVILYSTFWFDATVTLLRRWGWGENLAIAHREHAYQRLYRAGFSSKQILLGMIGLNSTLASLAVLASFKLHLLKWALVLTIVLLAIVYSMIEKIKPMEKAK